VNERQELVAALRALGLTQTEIGLRIGRSDVAVHKWMTGQTLPDADSIAALARAFPELTRYAVNVVLRKEPVV
jgi:transcriptional regulator with XRE-family HTH domain